MSLYETAKLVAKRRALASGEREIHLHDGVRDLASLGISPADATGMHPAVHFLVLTGLFDPSVCASQPSRLNLEFTGGTSRFAATDEASLP